MRDKQGIFIAFEWFLCEKRWKQMVLSGFLKELQRGNKIVKRYNMEKILELTEIRIFLRK